MGLEWPQYYPPQHNCYINIYDYEIRKSENGFILKANGKEYCFNSSAEMNVWIEKDNED